MSRVVHLSSPRRRTLVGRAVVAGVRTRSALFVVVFVVLVAWFGVGFAAPLDAERAALLERSNAARVAAGLGALAPDAELAAAAQAHAQEMARLGYLSHVSPTPERATLADRLRLAGAPEVSVGENLARIAGERDVAAAAVDGWLASPGHRRNLLAASFDRVGFGVARGASGDAYVAQVLAFAPAELTTIDARPADAERTRATIRLELAPGTEAVAVALGDAPGRRVAAAEAASGFAVTLDGADPRQLRIGAPQGGGWVTSAAAWLEPARLAWTADPSFAGGPVRIDAVTLEPSVGTLVRVEVTYRLAPDDPRAELALFVGDEHRPDARIAPGRFEVVVDAERRAAIRLGRVNGTEVAIFHAFHLAPVGGDWVSAAGAGFGAGAPLRIVAGEAP